MKNILILLSLLFSFHAYSQPYQEEDLYGFWKQKKTTFKNPADRNKLPGFGGLPMYIHYYSPDHTLMYVSFSGSPTEKHSIHHGKSSWKLLADENKIKVFYPPNPEEFTLLPINKLTPGKKLELIHTTKVTFGENTSLVSDLFIDTTDIELVIKFEKCSVEEALNVTKIDDILLYNREVSKVEWGVYAYDLENKDEIIFSDQITANEPMARQFDPILNISQEEAVAFCEWKTRQIKSYYGLDVIVRLPTQREWEKLKSSIKAGSQYRMDVFSIDPDLDLFYLSKPVKLLKDTYEWCAEEGLVYSAKGGAEAVSAATISQTGFRYIIEFL